MFCFHIWNDVGIQNRIDALKVDEQNIKQKNKAALKRKIERRIF